MGRGWPGGYANPGTGRDDVTGNDDVPTAIYELRAETVVEFIGLSRPATTRSAVTAHEVAQRAPDTGPGKLNASRSTLCSIRKRADSG